MSEGNLSDRRRQKDANRRDLLVLVHAYLLEEGLAEAAQAVRENWNFDNYEVCDNVDLQLILMEYQGFYQMRFRRQPKLTRKITPDSLSNCLSQSRRRRSATVKRRDPSDFSPEEEAGDQGQFVLQGQNVEQKRQGHDSLDVCQKLSLPKHLLSSEETKEFAARLARDFVPAAVVGDGCEVVVGHEEVQQALAQALAEITDTEGEHASLLMRCGLSSSNTSNCFLLAGPPGTGKTLLAKTAAAAAPVNVWLADIHASSLGGRWRGDSERLVRSTFEVAHANAPAIIFVDEADALLGDRGTIGEHEASKRCKSEFLIQLDGLAASSRSTQVAVVAATNLPWALDAAFLRRFTRVFHVGLPTKSERIKIVQNNFKSIEQSLTEALPGTSFLGELTEGWSGSDLTRACQEAKRLLYRKCVDRNDSKKTSKPIRIDEKLTRENLLEVFERTRPVRSTGDAWESKYDKWRRGHP